MSKCGRVKWGHRAPRGRRQGGLAAEARLVQGCMGVSEPPSKIANLRSLSTWCGWVWPPDRGGSSGGSCGGAAVAVRGISIPIAARAFAAQDAMRSQAVRLCIDPRPCMHVSRSALAALPALAWQLAEAHEIKDSKYASSTIHPVCS